MPIKYEKNASVEKNKKLKKWILISKEMVLIVSFQFVSFFWLSFQKPFLLCLPLPQLLMYPNLLVLLSIEHSLPIPALRHLFYHSASFDAGSCLDMLFIKSPNFPKERSFS